MVNPIGRLDRTTGKYSSRSSPLGLTRHERSVLCQPPISSYGWGRDAMPWRRAVHSFVLVTSISSRGRLPSAEIGRHFTWLREPPARWSQLPFVIAILIRLLGLAPKIFDEARQVGVSWSDPSELFSVGQRRVEISGFAAEADDRHKRVLLVGTTNQNVLEHSQRLNGVSRRMQRHGVDIRKPRLSGVVLGCFTQFLKCLVVALLPNEGESESMVEACVTCGRGDGR